MSTPEQSRLQKGNYVGYRVSVRLVREGSERYTPLPITGPEDCYDFLRELGNFDRETFYAIHLDSKHRVISCEEVSRGALDRTSVHPREVYKAAILSSAAAIIIAHNHPSGDPTPSPEDHGITERLYKAGELLGIPLLDHVIIGDGRFATIGGEDSDGLTSKLCVPENDSLHSRYKSHLLSTRNNSGGEPT